MRAFLALLLALLVSAPVFAQPIGPPGGSGGSATPSGAAGGDLGGTYPNPTVAKVGCGALPIGATCSVEIPSVSVASTGDAGSIAVANAAYTSASVQFYNCSAGAVGTISSTLRTAASGGGSALATGSTITPPASGSVSSGMTVASTTAVNTAATLYWNISATTATGTCSLIYRYTITPAS